MPPENEDQGLDVEAMVSKAVEKASTERAAAAADKAVTEKTPEIVAEAIRAAQADTKAVVTEVARTLKADFDAKMEQAEAVARATRSSFGLVSGKSKNDPDAAPYSDEPGVLGARILRAWVCADHNTADIPRVLQDTFHDRAAAEYVARALETSTPSKGGVLVVPEFAVQHFIDRLHAASVLVPMMQKIPMPSGALNIPGFSTAANMGWVNEISNNRSSTPAFRAVNMTSKKAFAMVAISNDLLEEASLDADRIVSNDIVNVLGELLDSQFLNGTRTAYTPGGLLTNTDVTKTALTAAVDADLPATIIARVMARNVQINPMNSGFIFNHSVWKGFYNLKTTTGAYHFREEMNQGRLLGYPFKVTTLIVNSVAANTPTEIYFGKWDEYLLGVTRELRFERSKEAAYYNESGTLMGAFPQDVSLIKATYKCDALPRIPEAFDITTVVHTS
jgi:HK97 family phage major capsid protein